MIFQFFSYLYSKFWEFREWLGKIPKTSFENLLKILCLILLVLVACILFRALYRIWLPKHFARRYGISRLPKHASIKRRIPTAHNSYVLRFPSWRYANSNGTRDMRRKGNRVNWKNSCLMVDSYKILIRNPLQMVRLVRHLRNQGIEVLPCHQELEKKAALRKKQTLYRSGSCSQLYTRFQDNPFEFEEYCAALFRAMGKRAETTSRTNDGGYDIVLRDPDGKFGIVECKCYAPDTKIGRPILQKLAGACTTFPYQLDHLIFVTTSTFSDEAKQFAFDFQQKTGISFGLFDGQTLAELSEKYLNESIIEKKAADNTEWQLTTADLKAYIPPDLYSGL